MELEGATEVGVEDGEVDVGVDEVGTEEVSPHATKASAISVETAYRLFLFISFLL